ncbi:serine hydrolase domain-containing protein [Burkholderia stagnalis]
MRNHGHPVLEDIDRRVGEFLDTAGEAFSGAYLVAINGESTLRGERGFANREFAVRNQPSTRFRIGSITKQFTAATILLLVEEGLLALDDPVARFLPAPNDAWRNVTLRMLLSHRSGILNYTSLPDFAREISKIDRTPLELVEFIRELPLDFEPGSRMAYSNSGYTLLGCVIERVCAQPYADVLAARLFGPLNMADTGYDDGLAPVPSLANGYTYHDRKWFRAPHISMSLPFAAGGLYSTVDDLARWHRALHDGHLLRRGSRTAMFTDYGDGMGFGIMLKHAQSIIRFHGGGINGFVAAALRVIDRDRAVDLIVLSNSENMDSMPMADPFFIANGLLALSLGSSVDAPGISLFS